MERLPLLVIHLRESLRKILRLLLRESHLLELNQMVLLKKMTKRMKVMMRKISRHSQLRWLDLKVKSNQSF
jgi:division protein CdvB (Snf7/Vps24/ESCRT-III family)